MSDNNPLNNTPDNKIETKPDFLANLVEPDQQANETTTTNTVVDPSKIDLNQSLQVEPLQTSPSEQHSIEGQNPATQEQVSTVQPLNPEINNLPINTENSLPSTSTPTQQIEAVQSSDSITPPTQTSAQIPSVLPLENTPNSGISIPVDASLLEKQSNTSNLSNGEIKVPKQGINPLLIAGIVIGIMIIGAGSYLVRAYLLNNQSVQTPTQTVVSNDQMDPLIGTTEENTQQSQQTQISQEVSTQDTMQQDNSTQISTQQGSQAVFTWGTENCKDNEVLDGEGKCSCKTNFSKNSEGLCKYDCTAVVAQVTDLRKNPTVKSSDELSTKLSNLEEEAKANSCTLPATQSPECVKLDNQAMDKMNAKDYNGFYQVSNDYIDKDCSLDKLTTCDKILAKGDIINKILASKPDKKTTKSFQTKLDQIKKDYYANTSCNVVIDRCVLLTQKYSGKTQETVQTESTNSIGKIDPGLIFADDKAYFDKNCKNIKLPEKSVTTQEQQTSTQESQQVKKGVSRKK